MGYERYPRNDRDDSWSGRRDTEYDRDTGFGGDYGRSSAREYAAAGQLGRDRDSYRNRDDYGAQSNRGQSRYGGSNWDRNEQRSYGGGFGGDRGLPNSGWDDPRRASPGRSGYDRRPEGYSYQDRDFFSRAGDEVRSWFGDDEAERRREQDARYDARHRDDERDSHYHGWRSRQIADLDRDYDEYRRENATRFENEFGSWRTERQGQRSSLSRVSEHMEVVGSDGQHVGTVDKVRGDRIVLTKNDADAGGRHHSIPSRWIDSVDDKVTIRKTANEAKAAWKDEERSGALFGEQGDRSGSHYLNRSFSGTY